MAPLIVRQWGTEGSDEGQFVSASGVVVNGDEVLVTDFDNNRVEVFGLDGTLVRQWGGAGDGAGQLDRPDGIAVSEGEVIVSCSHRVQVFR